jgi:Zn-dependent protease with chaperone function
MQLILIVQVSIALLAVELSGTLPVAPWIGLAALLLAPALVVLRGAIMNAGAQRAMDRGSSVGVERAFSSGGRVGMQVAALMVLAACTALPEAIAHAIGGAGVAVLFLGVAVVANLAHEAMLWPVEKRIRESALISALDRAGSVHPMPSRAAYVLARARAGLLPMLAPLLVPIALGELARAAAMRLDPAWAEPARFGGGVAGAVLLFVFVPLIVPPLLGLRRLEAGSIREELESMARDAGVGVREIWVWPTDGLVANAAVMGVVPGLRCVMLSDALLEAMPRQQVKAVMAHELGHVVRRHLLWLLVVILGCWTVAAVSMQPIAEAAFQWMAARASDGSADSIAQSTLLVRDVAVLAAGLLLFGFASRRFERQADTFAVQLMSRGAGSAEATRESVDAMVSALGSVAYLNHVPPERPSWRHGSIAWRQEYLRSIVGERLDALAIDGLVAVLRWGALLVVATAIVVASFGL